MKEGIFMRCNQNVFYHHFTFFVSDMSPNNLYKLKKFNDDLNSIIRKSKLLDNGMTEIFILRHNTKYRLFINGQILSISYGLEDCKNNQYHISVAMCTNEPYSFYYDFWSSVIRLLGYRNIISYVYKTENSKLQYFINNDKDKIFYKYKYILRFNINKLNKVLHDKVFNEKSYIDYSKTKHFNSKWDFVLFVNVLTGNNFKSFREAFNCLKFINEEYRCLNLGYYANANSSVWTTSMSLL